MASMFEKKRYRAKTSITVGVRSISTAVYSYEHATYLEVHKT